MIGAVLSLNERTRAVLPRIADYLVVALAVVLPWSTSAVSILVVIWFLVLLLTLDFAALQTELQTAAGGLPVALLILAAVGMTWADASLRERLHGAESFLRLLAIPFLFVQFRASSRGRYVLVGFLLSCFALLVLSYLVTVWPWLFPSRSDGVPVKSYLSQSAEFLICALALLYLATAAWKSGARRRALLFAVGVFVFLANIFLIASSRATLAVLPVILLIWAYRQFGAKGIGIVFLVIAAVMAALWASSSYFRDRIGGIPAEIEHYQKDNVSTSSGERLEFWKKSLGFIANAPVIGHGTGSIRGQFEAVASGQSGPSGEISVNPHNQTLTVAIQLGLVGAALLWAMWLSHLYLFRGSGAYSWFGLVIVLDNIGGSVFHSQLFDFTEGWLYVFGVGVLGGIVRQQLGESRISALR